MTNSERYLKSIDEKVTRATAEKDHHVPAERLAESLSSILKPVSDDRRINSSVIRY